MKTSLKKAFNIGCAVALTLITVPTVFFMGMFFLYLWGSADEATDRPVPMSEVITTPRNINDLTGVDFGAVSIDSAYASEADLDERKVRGHFRGRPNKAFWAQLSRKVKDDPAHWRYDPEGHTYAFARSWGFNGLEKPEGIEAERGTVRMEIGEGKDNFMIYEGADWTLTVTDYLPQDLTCDTLSRYFGYYIPAFRMVNYYRNMYRAGMGKFWHYEFVHVIRFGSPEELERLRDRLRDDEAEGEGRRPYNTDGMYHLDYSPANNDTYRLDIPKEGDCAYLTYTCHD